MAKKRNELSGEEKLRDALVPEGEQPYEIPENWVWTRLGSVCRLINGLKVEGEVLPYLEAKYLRGKINAKKIKAGNRVARGSKVILVDGENSGEVFYINENGYMGSTFKKLDILKPLNESYIELYILF